MAGAAAATEMTREPEPGPEPGTEPAGKPSAAGPGVRNSAAADGSPGETIGGKILIRTFKCTQKFFQRIKIFE